MLKKRILVYVSDTFVLHRYLIAEIRYQIQSTVQLVRRKNSELEHITTMNGVIRVYYENRPCTQPDRLVEMVHIVKLTLNVRRPASVNIVDRVRLQTRFHALVRSPTWQS